MTERVTGRHRATNKTCSPLSTLTGSLSLVSDCVGSVRRSGVIIAMSSGLVASMALPAHATASAPDALGATTASVPVAPGTAVGEALYTAPEGGLLALPPDLVGQDAPVAAPAAATVEFDRPSFSLGTGDDLTVTTGDGGRRSDDVAPKTRKERRQSETSASDSASDTTAAIPVASKAGAGAVSVAFRYQGVPYLWGGSTPRGFDCSGFTQYVYRQLGKSVGRTVADQRGDVKFVSRSQAKPGDLVFFGSSHVGIYLGNNQMIDAPRRGKTIQPRKIYSSNVQFGRVI